jgi:hypothetical protein
MSPLKRSILDPRPEEEKGTYDVVCIRFFTTVLTGDQWETALTNLLALLKLGGLLQWIDIDASQHAVYIAEPGARKNACLEVTGAMEDFVKVTGREFGGVRKLGSLFQTQDLKDVHEEVWSMGGREELKEEMGFDFLLAVRKS